MTEKSHESTGKVLIALRWLPFQFAQRRGGVAVLFGGLLLVLFSMSINEALAQRALTTPDLTALTASTNPKVSLDPRSGWLYAAGSFTRIMGVTATGLARTTLAGVVDTSWRPSSFDAIESMVVVTNGDIYVIEVTAETAYLARYSAATGAVRMSRRAVGGARAGVGSRVVLIGGQDRWLYYNVSELGDFGGGSTSRIRWSRIDTVTDQIDPQWTYSVLLMPRGNRSASMIQGADGALYVTAMLGNYKLIENSSNYYLDSVTAMVTRVGTAAGASLDAAWNPAAASRIASQAVQVPLPVVVNNELMLRTVSRNAPGVTDAVLTRFDVNGIERGKVAPPSNQSIFQVVGAIADKILVQIDRDIRVLDAATLREFNTIKVTAGGPGSVSQVIALPDGGKLVTGSFDVWYEGRRFRNFLRTRADGLPDMNWSPKLDDFSNFFAILTARGVVIFGFAHGANIPETRAVLVSLAADAVIDPPWARDWPQTFSPAFDGSEFFYLFDYVEGAALIQRATLSTGRVDPAWAIQAPQGRFGNVVNVSTDLAGGLWLSWQADDGFGYSFSTLFQRFDVVTGREILALTPEPSQKSARVIVSTPTHAYIGNTRYDLRAGGALDSAWDLDRVGATGSGTTPAIVGRYAYLADAGLRRALLTGNGTIVDTWALPAPTWAAQITSGRALLVTNSASTDDAVEFVANYQANYSSSTATSALVTTGNAPGPDKTIIEYFNRDAARYFITGRSNEQALLDALPAAFQRTGMQFSARSSLYRDIPDAPVCRFYSAPENGGSNTHFYGTGDDCPALNTVENLRYEGYDFSTIRPVGQSCAAAAPNPVSRLFNNKAASKQGNHRYVVSATTKAKLIALGWIDEGVVFCVTGVIDAAN